MYIYYPRSQGGGSKRLFRKVGDKSSEFYPDISTIRREGSYIYEEFLMTQGTDIKIYAVGRGYAHAEGTRDAHTPAHTPAHCVNSCPPRCWQLRFPCTASHFACARVVHMLYCSAQVADA